MRQYGAIYKLRKRFDREAAIDGHLAGIILNLSAVYVISSNSELGWVQEVGILVFDKENPSKAMQFMRDMQELQNKLPPNKQMKRYDRNLL